MCRINPFVDLAAGTLTVSAPGMPDLILPLDYRGRMPGFASPRGDQEDTCSVASRPSASVSSVGNGDHVGVGGGGSSGGSGGGGGGDTPMIVRVCGNRREGVTCAASASAWFTRFLGMPCSLVRAVDAAAVDTAAAAAATAATAATAAAAAAAVTVAADADATDVDAARSWTNGSSTIAPFADSGTPVTRYRYGSRNGNDNGNGSDSVDFPGTCKEENAGGGAIVRKVPWFHKEARLGGRRRAASSAPAAAAAAMTTGGGNVAANSRAFANEAPYLLISRASVAKVNDMIRRESSNTRGVEKVTEGGGGGGGAYFGGEGDAEHEQVRARACFMYLRLSCLTQLYQPWLTVQLTHRSS